MGRIGGAAAAIAVGILALAGCGSSDPLEEEQGGGGSEGSKGSEQSDSVVVGAANFGESKVLAEIYAGALNAEGIEATTKPDIGTREAYLGALEEGSVDIFPEYTGNLAVFYDEEATADTAEGWYDVLVENLPDHLQALEMSEAQDNDSVTVTRETADEYGLEQISDLEPVADQLVLGGPPEWAERERTGVPALEDVYGLTFKGEFKRLEGPLTVEGLINGQIDAGNVFTTNPAIYENDLVVLEDDKSLFPTNNVVPIVRTESGSQKITDTLNAVSAALDTETLSGLGRRVDIDNENPEQVAADWLAENDLS